MRARTRSARSSTTAPSWSPARRSGSRAPTSAWSSDVTVTDETEAAHADGSPEPGRAVLVLQIDDPGFQDFREDASCLIRPQSLLGEKFVECEPDPAARRGQRTAAAAAEVIEEGAEGEGERFLPLEANGKAVDLDLVNNIMREPYAERFRLILNDLGAGLAARGDDLAEIIDRSDPALRETNAVLKLLAEQSNQLAELARNGEAVLEPLARDRDQIGGFINSATTTAEATAERSAELEQNLALLPQTLREVRSTMTELKAFSDAGAPTFTQLAAAAPAGHEGDPGARPVRRVGRDGAALARRRRRRQQGSRWSVGPADPPDPQARELGGAGDQQPGEVPALDQPSRRLREPAPVRLPGDRGVQRLRRPRPLRTRLPADHQLQRLRDHADRCSTASRTSRSRFRRPRRPSGSRIASVTGASRAPTSSSRRRRSAGLGRVRAGAERAGRRRRRSRAPTSRTCRRSRPSPSAPTAAAAARGHPTGVGVAPNSAGRAEMRDARKLLDFLIGSDDRDRKGKR